MQRSIAICAVAVLFSLTHFACARQKKTGSKPAPVTVLSAYSQRTLPGRPESPVVTKYSVAVKMNAAGVSDFFFRKSSGWMQCSALRARYNKQSSEYFPVSGQNAFSKGDTLLIITQNEVAAPAGAPAVKENTLIFKSQKSGWQTVPISHIKKKDDLVMP